MPLLKMTILTTASLLPGMAMACDCPDKPMPQEALAPQIIKVAETKAVEVEPAPIKLAQASDTKMAEGEMQKTEMKDASMSKKLAPEAVAYQSVLENRISEGADGLFVFDYAGAKSSGDIPTIKAYVDHLESQNPETMSDNEAIAFWANLYNAVTLEVVLDNYPVSSIKKVEGGLFNSGPWKKEIITVNGQKMSLDNVEHDTLRKDFPSPYIHYMVNCASVGCPNLLPELWQADTLVEKRKDAADAYINSPRGVTIKGDKLVVSSIYDWFQEDFGGNKQGVLDHVSQHAGPELKTAIDDGARISGFKYDWDLNE